MSKQRAKQERFTENLKSWMTVVIGSFLFFLAGIWSKNNHRSKKPQSINKSRNICWCILHPLHCHFISPKMSFCWPARYSHRPFVHTMNSLRWLSKGLMSCQDVVTIMELQLTSVLCSQQSSYSSLIFQSFYISTTFGKENNLFFQRGRSFASWISRSN